MLQLLQNIGKKLDPCRFPVSQRSKAKVPPEILIFPGGFQCLARLHSRPLPPVFFAVPSHHFQSILHCMCSACLPFSLQSLIPPLSPGSMPPPPFPSGVTRSAQFHVSLSLLTVSLSSHLSRTPPCYWLSNNAHLLTPHSFLPSSPTFQFFSISPSLFLLTSVTSTSPSPFPETSAADVVKQR